MEYYLLQSCAGSQSPLVLRSSPTAGAGGRELSSRPKAESFPRYNVMMAVWGKSVKFHSREMKPMVILFRFCRRVGRTPSSQSHTLLYDFFWRDMNKRLPTPDRAVTDQRNSSIQVWPSEAGNILELLLGTWVTQMDVL